MLIKGLTDEDFVNYQKPSMFLAFPSCTFKCERECSECHCQNSALATLNTISVPTTEVIDRYVNNPITSAVVCGGLEPLDSYDDLYSFISNLRIQSDDDVVVYTGYKKDEVEDKIRSLSAFKNVVVKFGRYVPGQQPHADPVLGVSLASDNQYAERIS